MKIRLLLFTTSLFVLTSLPGRAGNKFWPQFRGPDGMSIAHGQTLPDNFGPEKNVLWKTALPPGLSSPCFWGDRIFLTAYDEPLLTMLCIRRSDGKLLWQKQEPLKDLQRYAHKDSSPSVPTPCTDGTRVAFLFGDYGLVVTDFEGNLIWEKRFIPHGNDYEFGYGASPVTVDGKLIINCDGGIRPGLLCLDFATGEELWLAERPGSIVSYASPFIWTHGGKTEVLQAGTANLSSYDISDGSPIWQVNNLPIFICPTPIADESAVYFGAWTTGNVSGSTRIQSLFSEENALTQEEISDPEAFYARFDVNKDRKISKDELPPSRLKDAFNFTDGDQSGFLEFEEFAPRFEYVDPSEIPGRNIFVSVAAGGKGDITDTHVSWEKRKNLPYVSSPLLYKNRLYLVKKGGTVSCLDPTTGKPHYERQRLGASGEYYASPIGVSGKVLIASQPGKIIILKAADDFEILSTIDFKEKILASPALADNRLYIRTDKHLWAF